MCQEKKEENLPALKIASMYRYDESKATWKITEMTDYSHPKHYWLHKHQRNKNNNKKKSKENSCMDISSDKQEILHDKILDLAKKGKTLGEKWTSHGKKKNNTINDMSKQEYARHNKIVGVDYVLTETEWWNT